MKKYFKILALIIAIMLGVFAFIYGGYDDSPGAQLLGVIILGLGAFGLRSNSKEIKFKKDLISC